MPGKTPPPLFLSLLPLRSEEEEEEGSTGKKRRFPNFPSFAPGTRQRGRKSPGLDPRNSSALTTTTILSSLLPPSLPFFFRQTRVSVLFKSSVEEDGWTGGR